MTGHTRLGELVRRLGSVLNVREVRTEDQVRLDQAGGDSAARIAQIEAEVLAVEQELS